MTSASESLPNTGLTSPDTGTSLRSAEEICLLLISLLEDSLASHSATQAEEAARTTTATSGRRCLESYEKSSRLSSWQRTFTASLLLMPDWYSKLCTLTWKLRATKSPHRSYFRLLPSVPYIEGIGSGFVPTPDTTIDAPNMNSNKKHGPKTTMQFVKAAEKKLLPTPKGTRSGPDYARAGRKGSGGDDLVTAVIKSLLPTPRAAEWKDCGPYGSKSQKYRLKKQYLDAAVKEVEKAPSGQLNPDWVEWLMGFPAGWTDLSGTPSPTSPA